MQIALTQEQAFQALKDQSENNRRDMIALIPNDEALNERARKGDIEAATEWARRGHSGWVDEEESNNVRRT